jgi:hypothetical protein
VIEMPLEKGASREVVSRNVATEIRAGKSKDQAVAIAMRTAGKSRNDAIGGYLDDVRRGDSNAVGKFMGHKL